MKRAHDEMNPGDRSYNLENIFGIFFPLKSCSFYTGAMKGAHIVFIKGFVYMLIPPIQIFHQVNVLTFIPLKTLFCSCLDSVCCCCCSYFFFSFIVCVCQEHTKNPESLKSVKKHFYIVEMQSFLIDAIVLSAY